MAHVSREQARKEARYILALHVIERVLWVVVGAFGYITVQLWYDFYKWVN